MSTPRRSAISPTGWLRRTSPNRLSRAKQAACGHLARTCGGDAPPRDRRRRQNPQRGQSSVADAASSKFDWSVLPDLRRLIVTGVGFWHTGRIHCERRRAPRFQIPKGGTMALGLIILCGVLSLVYGGYTVTKVLAADAGSQRMQEISARGARGRAGLSEAPVHDDRRRRRRRFHPARPAARRGRWRSAS